MLTAKLHNGKIIRANEYSLEVHGSRLFCLDKNCGVPLIYVQGTDNVTSHFKTSGKGESRHQSGCGFLEPMDLVDTLSKMKEYQDDGTAEGMKEVVIRLSMGRIDPDKETSTVEREREKKDPNAIKVKNGNVTPQSISSVKGVVKLLGDFEPDILTSILINIGGGRKVPLSDIVVDQVRAHNMLWNNESYKEVGYFVYGKVANMVKREKVMYINLEATSEVPFTVVIFQKHWNEFNYTENQLVGKDVLIYGHLRKNDFNDKTLTEMIIKSDKYIEIYKRKKKVQEDESIDEVS